MPAPQQIISRVMTALAFRRLAEIRGPFKGGPHKDIFVCGAWFVGFKVWG